MHGVEWTGTLRELRRDRLQYESTNVDVRLVYCSTAKSSTVHVSIVFKIKVLTSVPRHYSLTCSDQQY
jgi:hypothetical protein